MTSEEDNKQNDVVAIELPAPSGWTKKFTPKKGSTPQKNDIVFISPTGEEIKNKRQLDQYLKSHPGGHAASEFDWGTGDTPRRSARLSEKSKAVVAPPSQSPKKKQRKSSTKGSQEKSNTDAEGEATDEKDATAEETKETVENTKGAQEKSNTDAEGEATDEKDTTAEETKETVENSTVDAKDATVGEVITEGAGNPNNEDAEKKTQTEAVSEEPSGAAPMDPNTENLNMSIEESNNAATVVADAKIEESKEASTEVPDAKNNEPKNASDAGKRKSRWKGRQHSDSCGGC